MKLDLPLIAIVIVVAFAASVAAYENCTGPTLDGAQDKFEHRSTWPSPADFDGWRASGALKCHDHRQLRICEAMWPLFSPADGKPFGKDRVTFACSPEECSWVDP